jgi:hypothetical protein
MLPMAGAHLLAMAAASRPLDRIAASGYLSAARHRVPFV